MVTFDKLEAGKLTIENTSGSDKTVFIYVPNKDSIPYVLGAGKKFDVVTLSAGESFTYFSQATKDLTVKASAAAAG